MMGWRSLLTAGLLLIGVVTTWIAWRDREPEPLADLLAQRSDYVLYDFDLVSLNADGEEAFTLTAPQLQQTMGARTLELTTPTFFIPQGGGARRWQVNADTGWISANSDEVRLRGSVVAAPMDEADQTRIETKALNVFPQKELATSKVLVTLTRPGITMRGTGMRAYLDQNRVELLSKTRLLHDPSPR